MTKILFLDRDGVLNQDHGYTYKTADLKILDGVIEGMKAISNLGYKFIIITNQSGISRGLFTIDDFHNFMNRLIKVLSEHHISIFDYFFCPHHPDGVVSDYAHICPCRKPKPGLIFQARDKHDLDLSLSALIGDSESDILAGKNADIPLNILLTDSSFPRDSKASDIAGYLIQAARILEKFN